MVGDYNNKKEKNMKINEQLALELNMRQQHVDNIIGLIDEGCTIPFIARYRKEMTGSADDDTLRAFADRLAYLRNLNQRKEEVSHLISEQEKMTPEIQKAIDDAKTMTEVEDIYRPFKPKRKTRASVAIAKGLQGLADFIFAQKQFDKTLMEVAQEYVNPEKEVNTPEEAIAGAKDIIAEMISDNAELRKALRELFTKNAKISSKLLENENNKTYEVYAAYSEPVAKIPSHRILALNRGENEECLKVTLDLEENLALQVIRDQFLHKNGDFADIMEECFLDSYERLILASIEREIRNELTDKANEQAIKMFELNLRPLLLQPPLKGKVVLGFDPAYRTGCKLAVVDASGNLLDHGVVFPTPPQSKIEESEEALKKLIDKYKIDVISIGNGTASKESEIFVANLLKKLDRPVSYIMTNEAGASVYSASKVGAEEFPDKDVTVRSATSIARRIQDPLAELIKIDTKSIGVGQYQHDMPQKRLGEVLDGVVESCVNSVGVDLNTASYMLLSRISGLNIATAKSIVEYRRENGEFHSRDELLSVPKLGQKAYTLSAGFLRIVGAKNILDNTAVHPESYEATEKMLKLLGFDLATTKEFTLIRKKAEAYGLDKLAKECGVGVPTLEDIITELEKPGRDIRDSLPQPQLRTDIMDMADLKPNMELDGVVRNVIDFGAFVDIGVHQDGLVHISEICDRYIKHPSEELKVGDHVKVKVKSVDLDKKRIALSMRLDRDFE